MRLVFVGESDLDHAGDAMTSAIFSGGRPMTDAEFFAIGDTPERIELFDGSLHVTPGPSPDHQGILGELFVVFRLAAREVGLKAYMGIDVILQPGRIPIPDLIVSEPVKAGGLRVDGASVRLVCEIISPSNAATDRVLKMHYYSSAGIPWYLLVEPTGRLQLFRLADGQYVEHSTADVGQTLVLTEPVSAVLDPRDLLDPQ